MPGPWTTSTERKLLLRLIDPKATPRWKDIADSMGPDFSAEACRQKYYKLKNESAKLVEGQAAGSALSTPTKRKGPSEGTEEKKPTPPSKRTRKQKRDPLDGIPFSDTSDNSPQEVKPADSDMEAVSFPSFPNYMESMMAAPDYWMAGDANGEVKGKDRASRSHA